MKARSDRLFSLLTHIIGYYSVGREGCHVPVPSSERIRSLVNSKQHARKQVSKESDITCVAKSSTMRMRDCEEEGRKHTQLFWREASCSCQRLPSGCAKCSKLSIAGKYEEVQTGSDFNCVVLRL